MSISNNVSTPPTISFLGYTNGINDDWGFYSTDSDSYSKDSDSDELDDETIILSTSQIKNLPDSPNRALLATKACDTYIKVIQEEYKVTYEPNSAEFHVVLYCKLRGLKGAIEELDELILLFQNAKHKPADRPIPRRIVNMSHLTEIGKTGLHYLTASQKDKITLFNRITSSNGVFQASFICDNVGNVKESSFFPDDSIHDVDSLLNVIQNAKSFTEKENRALYSLEGLPFKVEMYRTHSTVTSAFPIFYYADYEENATYSIIHGQETLTSEQLLNAAVKAKNSAHNGKDNPVRYKITQNANQSKNKKEIVTGLIMDLAPYLNLLAHTPEGDVKLKRGVYICIKKTTLEDAINNVPN